MLKIIDKSLFLRRVEKTLCSTVGICQVACWLFFFFLKAEYFVLRLLFSD